MNDGTIRMTGKWQPQTQRGAYSGRKIVSSRHVLAVVLYRLAISYYSSRVSK